MKIRLLSFFGLVIAAIGLSVTLGSAPVYAKGEKYKWINANTIQASGGLYKNVTAANDEGVLNFPKQGNAFVVFSEGDCDITLTINVAIDNKHGTLKTEGCEDAAKDFDRSFIVANPEKGPPYDGSDVNYSTVNCSEYYEGGLNVYRCEAVKSCIQDADKSKNECLAAWNSCMYNESPKEIPTTEHYEACQNRVGSGDLTDAAKDEETAEEETTSCRIDGIGWIICPVMNFLAAIVDASYEVVENFLVVQPLLTTGETEEIYEAWSIMRNLANVAFVIVFLIIIYSQVTSFGVSNYGIKKMLPRLIMAAIFVNISYWICAIAVDISNILGSSIKGFFDSVGAGLAVPEGGAFSGGGWVAVTGGVLAGTLAVGAALYIGLSALIPAVIAALLAIVTVFIVLTLRQALIILLIVVAPLAFVAYVLPNTENWFTKWRKLFGILLGMYVIIAGIFGASQLASNVIIKSSDDIAVQIMGAAVTVIPLFITPIVMKASGGVLNRFGLNNLNKGPFDRMRRAAEGYRKNRQTLRQGRALNSNSRLNRLSPFAASTRRRARREQINRTREGGLTSARTRYLADEALSNDAFATQMAGGSRFVAANEQAKAAVIANAVKQQQKAFKEDVEDMEAKIKVTPELSENLTQTLQNAMNNGDSTTAVAAQNLLFAQSGPGVSNFRRAIEGQEGRIAQLRASGNNEEADRLQGQYDAVASQLRANIKERHASTAKAKGSDVLKWANATGTVNPATGQREYARLTDTNGSGMSDADVASQHNESLRKLASRNMISREQAKSVLNDPRLAKDLNPDQKATLNSIANAAPTPVPGGAPPAPTTRPATTPPSPQRYTAPFSRADLQSLGPQNIRNMISSAGGTASLSDGDIAKLINAMRPQTDAASQALHADLVAERNNRRGSGTPPTTPSPGPLFPPGGPTPPSPLVGP